jgi:dolichol kinase
MVVKLFFALAPVGFVLISSELLWRKNIIQGERARKFIHVLAGVWMAFWPFYIPFDGIFVLSAVAITLLMYSRFTKLFHAIYATKRKTYGDILYGFALLLCSYYGRADWVFTVSILILAIADGGAAIVGRLWGSSHQYYVFGKQYLRKSWHGTAAFLLLTYLCLMIGWLIGGENVINDNLVAALIFLPPFLTFLENVVPYGFDNVTTPLAATLILNSLL